MGLKVNLVMTLETGMSGGDLEGVGSDLCVSTWVLVPLVCSCCKNSLRCSLRMCALTCMLDLNRGVGEVEEDIPTLSHLHGRSMYIPSSSTEVPAATCSCQHVGTWDFPGLPIWSVKRYLLWGSFAFPDRWLGLSIFSWVYYPPELLHMWTLETRAPLMGTEGSSFWSSFPLLGCVPFPNNLRKFFTYSGYSLPVICIAILSPICGVSSRYALINRSLFIALK